MAKYQGATSNARSARLTKLVSGNDVLLVADADDSGGGRIVFQVADTEVAAIENDGLGSGLFGGSQPIAPEDYGAVGDGTTDDTAALASAIASGKNVRFKLGKTYLHRRQLNLSTAGQIIDGNGATLKRAAQFVSTTTTSITSGVTSQITLASVTGLSVGDQIVVEQGGTFDSTARTITNIGSSSKVVTISGTFGVSLSGTTNVRTGWNQLAISAADCRVANLILDGNVSNWSWGRWQHTCAITTSTSAVRAMVDHCRFVNQYGDAMTGNAYGQRWVHNTVDTVKGRGFVLGGIVGQPYDIATVLAFNTFLNTNGDTAVAGSDGTGAIAWSQGGPSIIVHGNYVAVGVDGISGLKAPHGSETTITGNEFWDCSSYAINCGGGGTADIGRVIVADNRLYGSGITFDKVGVTGYAAKWDVHDNMIVGGQVFLKSVTDINFHDNLVDLDTLTPPAANQITATAVTGGGSFAGGTTYYYKLTATNAAGETTGSAEVSAAPAANGSVALTWDPVPGATGYKIYRATSSGGQNGATSLLATITAATTVSYTDTGAATTTGAIASSNTTRRTTINAIECGTSSGICTGIVAGNRVLGGQYGILVNTGSTNLVIESNLVKNQYTYGVYASVQAQTGIVVRGNTIVADASADTSNYRCIRALAGDIAFNTCDFSALGGGGGINVNGGASTTNVVVRGNRVTGGSNTNVLVVGASVPGCVVRDNFLDHAVSDSGTGTWKSGNQYARGSVMAGQAVLVGGTVTVSTAEVVASDNIILSTVVKGGTQGDLSVGTITAGTSFVINSTSGTDTSTVYWRIDH